jgi:hypothetical protein
MKRIKTQHFKKLSQINEGIGGSAAWPIARWERDVEIEMGAGRKLPSGLIVNIMADVKFIPPHYLKGSDYAENLRILKIRPKVFVNGVEDVYNTLSPEDKQVVNVYTEKYLENYLTDKYGAEPEMWQDTIG